MNGDHFSFKSPQPCEMSREKKNAVKRTSREANEQTLDKRSQVSAEVAEDRWDGLSNLGFSSPAVSGIQGGDCGDWWLLWSVVLHTLSGPYPLESHVGKAFFLLHLGDALKAQWTLTLGLVTQATWNMNNSRPRGELSCSTSNSHKCLDVFQWKDPGLWDLVNTGSTFCVACGISQSCSLKENTRAALLSGSLPYCFIRTLSLSVPFTSLMKTPLSLADLLKGSHSLARGP